LKYSVSQFDGTNVARTEPNAMSGFGVSMLDIGIALGLALMGFALGYGTREVVSYRRRQAARERYRQLGLVD
jgi:predicted MFS family arabinose efflux permease